MLTEVSKNPVLAQISYKRFNKSFEAINQGKFGFTAQTVSGMENSNSN